MAAKKRDFRAVHYDDGGCSRAKRAGHLATDNIKQVTCANCLRAYRSLHQRRSMVEVYRDSEGGKQ